MIRLCLDTTGYSRLMRGHERLRERLEEADELLLPVTVLGELYAGFLGGRRPWRTGAASSRMTSISRPCPA